MYSFSFCLHTTLKYNLTIFVLALTNCVKIVAKNQTYSYLTIQKNYYTYRIELENSRKYELLARNNPICHDLKRLGIDNSIEAYIQSRVIKKTLESISLEYRQGLREGGSAIEDVTSILKKISSHDAGENYLFYPITISIFEKIKYNLLTNHLVLFMKVIKYRKLHTNTFNPFFKNELKFITIKAHILLIDKKSKEIFIVEIGVTSIDNLQQVETEKLRKYDLLANELGLIHGCKTKIIPYVLTWDGIVTKYHVKYGKALEILDRIEDISNQRRLNISENERNENLHTKIMKLTLK
ncbi:hypothetical protein NAPIS_ORF01362 [Vairimorpha apis BRL 01]|uniref:Uncharacterized protein n=1 Tax=Vairimorpha apis BRL 01 TaxID=1037528 RepID=T0L9G7_9MICR|nr:hypothetical protein NAPIS_ORF01362 [Vairimorpha apis BRL 01]